MDFPSDRKRATRGGVHPYILIPTKGPPGAGPRAFSSGLLSWAWIPLYFLGVPDMAASLPCPNGAPELASNLRHYPTPTPP